MIREINSDKILEAVASLCVMANKTLPEDLCNCISCSKNNETNILAKDILNDLEKNISAAREYDIPVCQDTGMAVVFVEIGQDVHIVGDLLEDAINKGIAKGYENGYLRKSVVKDPINRINTNDNTPGIIHTQIVKGDKIKITVAPKGFGSENMSRIYMLNPSVSEEDIIDKVVETVILAGGNPCPPLVVGVGIGGDFEMAAILSKKALCRSVSKHNEDDYYANLEKKILDRINKTGIGPQGFGGDTTALAVLIETYPTHIAGLPLAVNIGCHVSRHKSIII